MQIGGLGMNSPYAGNMGGASPAASAGNGQTTQDLQDQQARKRFPGANHEGKQHGVEAKSDPNGRDREPEVIV